MPNAQPNQRDPRYYTPEYVKELRKERDLYARTLLNSVGGPNAPASTVGGNGASVPIGSTAGPNGNGSFPTPALSSTGHHGSTTLAGTPIVTTDSASGSIRAPPRHDSISRTAVHNIYGSGSRANLATSQGALPISISSSHMSSHDPHIGSGAGGGPRTPAGLHGTVRGSGPTGGGGSGSRPGSSHSLNLSRQLQHPGGGNTAGASRRRASVISFNSTIARQPQGGAFVPGGSTGQFGRAGVVVGSNGRVGAGAGMRPIPLSGGDDLKGKHGMVIALASSSSIHKMPQSASVSKVGTVEEASFRPIVGNVIFQMSFHYLWYGILLFLGYLVNWIRETRPVAITMYLCTSFVVTQLSRIVYARNELSLFPLYMSFLPFLIFCLLARESHTYFSVLWFICIMVINMQCGASSLTRHIVLSWFCMIATYVLAFALMYDCSPLNVYNFRNGLSLRELHFVAIRSAEVGTFILAMALLLLGLFMLQRFIKRYAYFLVDRQRRMARLQAANAELRDRLKSLKVEVNLDLDSPITKVIQIIKSIQVKENMDGEVIESLDYVIGILSSNKLFQVDLGAFKDNIDKEVKSWLDNMLQAKETNASPELNNGNPIAFVTPDEHEEDEMNGVAGVGSNGDSAASAGSADSVPADGGGNALVPVLATPSDPAEAQPVPGLPEIVYNPVLANDTLIQQALASAESWDFNCFELAQVTNGRPLFFLAQHIFVMNDFYATFNLDHAKVERFFTRLEASYRLNPYHNSIHGTDVMHGAHYFLTTLGMSDLISIEERLACILAAACHDVDHPGVTNAFLVETRSDLAVRYNDQSVLENHHAAKAFELLLGNNETNFLACLPKKTLQHLRQCMIKMVLATDMAMHYELHTKFKNKVSGAGINVKDVKDRQLLMEISIKCADVSNPTRPPHLSQKWTELVMNEFYQQGDIERSLNIPISRFMDRFSPGIGKCQLGFIEFVVLPLYETWDMYMNEDDIFPGLHYLAINREFWKTWQDPPGSGVPVLSDVATPDYLRDVLGRPTVVTPFASVFGGLATVCNTALPGPCKKHLEAAGDHGKGGTHTSGGENTVGKPVSRAGSPSAARKQVDAGGVAARKPSGQGQ
ncbi:hypothetical protein BCR44DRAFT_26328 [Catenaria anguillulae PL171]|uniref:Phosphodiesterase n=1 Tax=Catenaria anguillulae PL171 TaxID=765915 RepID=A0A1Y2HRT5_9FUNG|nr:hypothetical protein BCR44DRAFT_26328 [Catenaria anguillulae PL171]